MRSSTGSVMQSPFLALISVALISWPSLPGSTSSASLNSKSRSSLNHNSKSRSMISQPLWFEPNCGQADPTVKFISHGSLCNLFMRPGEVVFGPPDSQSSLCMKIIGADPAASTIGVDELKGKINYFTGNDPKRWRTKIPIYSKVRYKSVYPDVDLLFYNNERETEYDFIVAPGGDFSVIRLAFEGAQKIRIDPNGDIVVQTALGEFRQRKPNVYQEKDGIRQAISCCYALTAQNQITFEVGAYDVTESLIIDPVLSYSTYFGGSDSTLGQGIAVDSVGNVYLLGETIATDLPITPGAPQPVPNTELCGNRPCGDMFVMKLNAAGDAITYLTYLGGNGVDEGTSIAVDAAGSAYITAITDSTNFPVTPGAFQPVPLPHNSSNQHIDVVVAKLDASGTALEYSTYLSGSDEDWGNGIAVDSKGCAYVVGDTSSRDFPITLKAYQTRLRGFSNIYVTKLNEKGTELVYSTYIGGRQSDSGNAIAVDMDGNAYIAGDTNSRNFPITPGAFQRTFKGDVGGTVSKLNAKGTALIYSTYLSGSKDGDGYGAFDTPDSIAVDSEGNAYVVGEVSSVDFPTTPGAFQRKLSDGDTVCNAFVTKLDASGTELVYSTYFGGEGGEQFIDVAVDSAGNACITGETESKNLPTTPNAFQRVAPGNLDIFLTKFDRMGASLIYSTYLGASGTDSGDGSIALDAFGNVYLTGSTFSIRFPTLNALQPNKKGTQFNAFITKFVFAAKINSASVVGDRLVVAGANFDAGATIIIDGKAKRTANDEMNPTALLISKQAAKKIAQGQSVNIQVLNSNGTMSERFSYTRQ